MVDHSFPTDLKKAKYRIRQRVEEAGLDAFEVIFEVVDYKTLNSIAAFQGFPTRYPHWRWGMEFNKLAKGYVYGVQTIYELVINNDPCYAYLLQSNDMITQKMVMAHVYGHCDFFKNNLCFAPTNRKMMDEMANHAARIRSFSDRYGDETVEEFIDVCLSLENLIDIHSPHIRRHRMAGVAGAERDAGEVARLRSKDYMDHYINPPEFLAEQELRRDADLERESCFPSEPVRDVLQFVGEHAPLQAWQREVLSIVREEAYYFAPQAQTKIMNEGWASYWHSTLCTEGVLGDAEIVEYAQKHAGVTATSGGAFNPYKIGIELFRHIEERWDHGRFGLEYDACDTFEERNNWDRKLGLGREKIFEVRRLYNDVTFIDEFLTEDFCREYKLFSFGYNQSAERYEIESREFQKIKQRLLFALTNAGQPIIDVIDGNYQNRGELLLKHRFEGTELDGDKAKDTLFNLHRVWNRPVHVISVLDGKESMLGFDGREFVSSGGNEAEKKVERAG